MLCARPPTQAVHKWCFAGRVLDRGGQSGGRLNGLEVNGSELASGFSSALLKIGTGIAGLFSLARP
jgi:hypothetical protein